MSEIINVPDRVAWLGQLPAPSALTNYLSRQGVTLTAPVRGQPLPPARLITLDAVPRSAPVARADGRRVVVLHPDASSATSIAQALRARGAEVIAVGPQTTSLEPAEALVPDAVLVDLADLHRSCWEFVRTLWSHPRLRFSPLLLAPPGSLHVPGAAGWDVSALCGALHTITQDYRRVTSKARKREELTLRLDRLGPVRTLHALMDAERPLRVRVDTRTHTLYVDIVGPLVIGALGGPCGLSDEHEPSRAPLLGARALAPMLAGHEAAVSVRVVARPAVTNIMAPLAVAVHSAVTGKHLQAVVPAHSPYGVTSAANKPVPSSDDPVAHVGPGSHVPAPSRGPRDRTLIGLGTEDSSAARHTPEGETQSPSQAPPIMVSPAYEAPPALTRVRASRPFDNTVKAWQPAGSAPGPSPSSPAAMPFAGDAAAPADALSFAAEVAAEVAARDGSAPHDLPAPSLAPAAGATPGPGDGHVVASPATVTSAASTPPPAPTGWPADEPSESTPPAVPVGPDTTAVAAALVPDVPRDSRERPAPHAGHLPWERTSRLRRYFAAVRPSHAVVGIPVLLLLAWAGSHMAGSAADARQAKYPAAATAGLARGDAAPVRAAPTSPAAPRGGAPGDDDDEVEATATWSSAAGVPSQVRQARTEEAAGLVREGNVDLEAGRRVRARGRYVQALALVPGYPRAVAALARLELAQGRPRDAVNRMRPLVHAYPRTKSFWLLLGDAYEGADLHSDATDAWMQAKRLGSRTAAERVRGIRKPPSDRDLP